MKLTDLTAKLATTVSGGLAKKTPGTDLAVRGADAPTTSIAVNRVFGNVTIARGRATGWYHMPERPWMWVDATTQEELIAKIADQYATLAGRTIHIRRTTVPFPVRAWAHRIHGRWGRTVLNHDAWARQLVRAQKAVIADGSTLGMTLLGVDLGPARAGDEALTDLARRIGLDLAGNGLGAEPATEYHIAWAITRSIILGLDPPGRLDLLRTPGQVYALSDLADRYKERYGKATLIVNRHSTDERYTAVVTVGEMPELEIPGAHLPWLHLADALPFPVEISIRGRIVDDDPRLRHRLRQVRSQQNDYRDHDLDEPLELARAAEEARAIDDQIHTGTPGEARRAHIRIRLAVSAPTLKDVLDRVDELTRVYRSELRVQLVHGRDQDAVSRSFIPGEADVTNGWLRRMPLTMLAAAMPHAGGEVGDGEGSWLGITNGPGRRPVFFDATAASRANWSGLGVFVGDPGSGKSTLLGRLAHDHALRGVRTTILDPSGPLARLADVPALAGHTRVINLTGADAGTLAPYALIPDPARAAWPTTPQGDLDYANAVKSARAERRGLALDIAGMLLGAGFTGRENLLLALRRAMQRVDPTQYATLDDVVTELHTMGAGGDVDAKTVETLLNDARDLPHADTFFGQPPAGVLAADAPLTVITMAGLQLPDLTIERAVWSVDESIAVALLHAAYRLAVRRAYSGDMQAPKFVGLDEAHILSGWPSGRAFLVRLARDSRKWHLGALLATQNPADLLTLAVQNLISTVFVGRVVEDPEVTADAVRLLRLPAAAGFEKQLAGLSATPVPIPGRPTPPDPGYREVAMRDMYGRVGRVEIYQDPDLARHLNTTPGGPR